MVFLIRIRWVLVAVAVFVVVAEEVAVVVVISFALVLLREVGVLHTFQSDCKCASVERLHGVDVHDPGDLVARKKGGAILVKLQYH